MADPNKQEAIVIQVTRAGMGNADPELSQKLLAKYFDLLVDANMLPAVVSFYTEGVQLVCEGSPVLPQLQALEARGVRLVVCSTCLDFYGLKDKVRVGLMGGMTDIIEAQWRADKVITL